MSGLTLRSSSLPLVAGTRLSYIRQVLYTITFRK